MGAVGGGGGLVLDLPVHRTEPRRAVSADASAAADLWWRARTASVPFIPAPVHDEADVHEWFATVVLPHRETWVIDDGAELCALLVLEPGWIDQLYVAPGHTGRGLGGMLVDVAKRTYPAGLDLWAFAANVGALRFYENHGLTAVDRTDGDNEEGAPDVRYRWQAS